MHILDSKEIFHMLCTRMTPSRILLFICLSFIAGIALESYAVIPRTFVWGILILAVGAIMIDIRGKIFWPALAGFCLLAMALGIIRMQAAQFDIAQDPLRKLHGGNQDTILTGIIADGPDVRDSSQKLKVRLDGTDSMVLVTARRYPEYRYRQRIELRGPVKAPAAFDDFNYQSYLMKDGIYSVMDFPEVTVISPEPAHTPFTAAYEAILRLRESLRSFVQQYFAVPHSSLLEGIMIGDTRTMPADVKEKMSATGLTHLTAISGSNVVVVAAIMMSCLLLAGFWRQQAFYASFFLVWLYIAIAGFPASGVRAGIMASIFLLAERLGRQNTVSRTIILAGALMLLFNPLLLWYDVGFQLSFLASLGIIHIMPVIQGLLMRVFNETIVRFLAVLSVTLAAQLATAPVIAWHFKSIALVALPANLLVIPVVGLIMLLGFAGVLLAMIAGWLGFAISLPTMFLTGYFFFVMDALYFPGAALRLEHVPLAWVAAYYALLALAVWHAKRKMQPAFLGY